ncbi:MAG: ligand-binding sensor domain-containing protein [Candidatus Latescibacterota bacterium]|jgi:ligand-binding sensor domain-containing protein
MAPFGQPVDQPIRLCLASSDGSLWFDAPNLFGRCKDNQLQFYDMAPPRGVTHALEDRNGHVWFGSWGGGLCRYDGGRFSNYTRDDGLAHDEVEAICHSRSGDMWFATRGGGASRYDGHRFTNYDTADGLPHNLLWSIYEDKAANLWFGSNSTKLTRFDGERFVAETDLGLHPASAMIWSFCEDHNGHLWFATNGSGIACYDGE